MNNVDVRIASLEPFKPFPPGTITAEISLIWPYSSSTSSSALLLVDPDFRQRHHKGQIRVRFKNGPARALAREHVGIGDVVVLELSGARWLEKNAKALNLTPGKAVDAEVLFDRRLYLRVLEDRNGRLDERTIAVDEPETSREAPPQWTPSTPVRSRGLGAVGLTTPFTGGHASPSFMKRLRLSQEHFLDSPGLASVDGQSDGSYARKRQKASHADITLYKISEGSPARRHQRSTEEREVDSLLSRKHSTAERRLNSKTDIKKPDRLAEIGQAHQQQATDLVDAPTGSVHGTTVELALSISSGLESDPDEEEDEAREGEPQGEARDNHASDQGSHQVSRSMPPPALPALTMPPNNIISSATGPQTPSLHPVSGLDLPIPSPFPQTPLTKTPTLGNVDGAVLATQTKRSGYFDNLQHPPSLHASHRVSPPVNNYADPQQNVPLARVIREPELLEARVEGHASPSSGSEADVSSDEQTGRKTTSMAQKPMHDNPGEAELHLQPSTIELPALDNESAVPSPQIQDSGEKLTELADQESEESGLSGVDEPSDDDDGIIPTGAHKGLPIDPTLAFTQSSSDSELSLVNQSLTFDQVASSPTTMNFPANGVVADIMVHEDVGFREHTSSRMSDHHRSDASTVVAKQDNAYVGPENVDGQDDTDAAFAAMDVAMDSLGQQSLEKQQAPGPPLASTVEPIHRNAPPLAKSQMLYPGTNETEDEKVQRSAGRHSDEQQKSLELSGHMGELESQRPAMVQVDLVSSERVAFPTALVSIPDSFQSPTTVLAVDDGPLPREIEHPRLTRGLESSQGSGTGNLRPFGLLDNTDRSQDRKAEPMNGLDKDLHAQLDANGTTSSTKASLAKDSPDKHIKREAMSPRSYNVPEVLNTWFQTAPRTRAARDDRRRTTTATTPGKAPSSTAPIVLSPSGQTAGKVRQTSVSPPPLKRYTSSQGLTTSLAYFTPLTNLDMHLNSAAAKIDVIAVATRASDEAKRAKSGPRDWYTVVHVADPELYEQQELQASTTKSRSSKGKDDVRVEVFRPWKASLPAVSEGDVLLLRNFVVRSRGRRTYLLSGEESAWCAFRDGMGSELNGDDTAEGKGTSSSLARGHFGDDALHEEVRGPPLEVGHEERRKAVELRNWFHHVQMTEKGKKRATL